MHRLTGHNEASDANVDEGEDESHKAEEGRERLHVRGCGVMLLWL